MENLRVVNIFKARGNSSSGGASNYSQLSGKPQINNIVVDGNKTLDDYGIQKKLTAGSGISIDESGRIDATGGGSGTTDYDALTNKPQINNVELSGNKTLDDLDIASKTTLETDYLKKTELPADITTQGNEFNTGGKLVRLEIDGKLPALDGSNLINLPGGSGTGGDTIPLTNTDGTISNSKLYKGLESTDGIVSTIDGYAIAYRIKDIELLPSTIQNWLAEKGATTSPTEDVELATASNTQSTTGQPDIDNYALVYTTTNELKITLNSSSSSGSTSEEVYIASFTDTDGTLSLNPKYNASFRFSSAKALVPSDIIENFKIIEFVDFPHIDGFDKSFLISGKTTEDRKLELQKILSNNTLVSYVDNKYLRLLLNDLTPVYFALSDNKLQAFSQKEGNNKSVINDLVDTTNLLAEPNTLARYTGDFAVDFASNASTSNIGGGGNAIAFYTITSAATNQPGNATKGIMLVKVGFSAGSGIPSGIAIYFADDGIHYTIGAAQPWGAGYWTGTWNTLSLATGG